MAVAVFFLVATIGAIIASFTRGAWLDEYITLRLSDADFSIEQLFVERWVFDTNPPLYFFFVRVAAEFLGMDYTVLRLTNLVPLLAFAAFVAGTYVKLPAARHFLLAFTVLWCASMWFGDFFPELRNYFAQHAFGSIFLLALVVLHGWKEAAERASTWLWTWMFVSLTIIVNLHMISTLYAGALIAAFGAYNLIFPQYRMRAVWLAVGGILSIVPLVAFVALTFNYLSDQSETFWITTSTISAIRRHFEAFAQGSGFSVVGCVIFLIAANTIVREWLTAKAAGKDALATQFAKDRPLVSGAILFGGLALGSIALLIINALTPMVILRYLNLLSDGLNIIIALAFYVLPRHRAIWLGALILNGLLALAHFLIDAATQPRWRESAEMVIAELEKCPGAPVYSTDWTVTESGMGKYRLAKQYGFEIEHNLISGPPLAITPNECGAILWLEHVTRFKEPAETVEGLLANVNVTVDPSLTVESYQRTETGAVVTFRR